MTWKQWYNGTKSPSRPALEHTILISWLSDGSDLRNQDLDVSHVSICVVLILGSEASGLFLLCCLQSFLIAFLCRTWPCDLFFEFSSFLVACFCISSNPLHRSLIEPLWASAQKFRIRWDSRRSVGLFAESNTSACRNLPSHILRFSADRLQPFVLLSELSLPCPVSNRFQNERIFHPIYSAFIVIFSFNASLHKSCKLVPVYKFLCLRLFFHRIANANRNRDNSACSRIGSSWHRFERLCQISDTAVWRWMLLSVWHCNALLCGP